MDDPDIIDTKARRRRSLWDTCGPGVHRDHQRQRQQQLDIQDEHMVDPGKIQNVFYIVATANWDKTSQELDDTALATMALLGLRELKEAVERPLADLGSGGVTAFRRSQARLNTVLDEVARRKEAVEEEALRRGRSLGSAPEASPPPPPPLPDTDSDDDDDEDEDEDEDT